ncbi:MAG: phage tail terminator-like protein [Polyangia bacterium]
MTLDDLETALGQHLTGMTNCPPIVWMNKDAEPSLPYLRFRHDPVSRIAPTLAKDIAPDQVGLVIVTIVTQSDTFTTEANVLAEQVADRFPEGLRLAAGSGNILIDRSEPVAGLLDDRNNWTVPVRIRYRTDT